MQPRPCPICGVDLPVMKRRHARTCGAARCRKALQRRDAQQLEKSKTTPTNR